ncbi:Lactoylglutathione lyase [Dimargaris cristalligena]|uniref:Lactoylglutathione lyase n=1 Tax=Dimargaris cristalligena TaxID=215637 RepID=A0A4Q0A139_9FUNG|nr:Lactoylglutathione lyase [Dimargaris cristalligena]RKP39161.1 Glyoxalase/Bleomycin resistance protein/Dihydroxybiphenyl dioxygenase [Dimargaris cristalligena]|eukprot:RKP39161.1 Glyoxalase/Bleomycin resistance protein/Dihydroxybiphenyl dioxygenase [Dimargaris cristalligena]
MASQTTNPSSYRFNHTMYRVKDPQVSIKFYTEVLGMSLLRKMDHPDAKFTLYFLAYSDDKKSSAEYDDSVTIESKLFGRQGVLELTHNWGTENDSSFEGYQTGNGSSQGYGHIAIAVDDVHSACERLEKLGVPFKKRLQDGRMNNIAFITDPDGYWVEIIPCPGQ